MDRISDERMILALFENARQRILPIVTRARNDPQKSAIGLASPNHWKAAYGFRAQRFGSAMRPRIAFGAPRHSEAATAAIISYCRASVSDATFLRDADAVSVAAAALA